MASGNETTTKFKVDISELKKGIQDANRQIKLANAEFKAASASMENWGKNADGLSAKISQTEKVLKAQKTILRDYEKQLALIVAEYGESSKEADEMRIKIENQRATVIKTEKSLGDYKSKLAELEAEQKKAGGAYDSLKAKIAEQEKRLESLKAEYSNVVLEQGKNSDSAKDLAGQIYKLSTELNDNRGELEKVDKAADDLDNSLDDVSDSAADAGNGGFTVLKGALANLLSDGIELVISGLKRLGDAVVEAGKQSISNYAEYEQLVGGVETLFKDSAKQVQKYASNAFKTAGLSANDYMETVTSFSASLLQGLNGDTAKAAKIADLAITDMSDNANKMGTSMESIQNAYQGFAKQNYTMLDNLKLGYGGTQEEMARLINDTGVMGKTFKATAKNVKDVSFDKIIEAIHKVQEEMGITGTTALEAAETIEGSKNAMQASWSNLLTGLSDENADIDQLWETFISSAKTYLGNILPRIETLVGQAVGFVKEKLKEKFPEAWATIESTISTVKDVFNSIVPVVTDVFNTISPIISEAFDKISTIISDVFGWIIDHKDEVIAGLAGIGAAIVAWNIATVVTNIVKMVNAIKMMGAASAFAAAKQWLLNTALLANPIGLIVAAIAGLVTAFVVLWKRSENFRNFWIGLWEKIKKAFSGFIDAWGVGLDIIKEALSKVGEFFKGIWDSIQESASNLIENVVGFFSGAWEKIKSVWNTVSEFFSGVWESIKEIFSAAIQAIIEYFQPMIDFWTSAFNIIVELAEGCWETIKAVWAVVSEWFNTNVIQPVSEFFTILWEGIKEAASTAWELIKLIWQVVSGWFDVHVIQPVSRFFSDLWNGIKTAASTAWNGIKTVWNVVSGWFKKTIITPVSDFFTGMWDGLKTGASKAWDGIKSVFGVVVDWFKDKFSKAWQAVKDVFSTGGKVFDGIKEGIVSAFKTVVNAIIRGINKVIAVPFNAINGILDKIQGVSIAGIEPFKNLVHRLPVPEIPQLAQGGVLKRGQVGLLEGDGAEAVVPLENNKRWIAATASQLKKALVSEGVIGVNGGSAGGSPVYNFNQYNTSPKALSRLEIYRQSKNLLHMKGAT